MNLSDLSWYLVARCQIEDSIMKDVDRTFPGHRLFEQPSGQLALRRVLRAISHRIPEVGYCQSMNFVVAALLVVLEEEQAFWVADVLFQEYFTPDYFTYVAWPRRMYAWRRCTVVGLALVALRH